MHDIERPDNIHDKGYKYLIGIKKYFVQLLRSFVKEGWVQSINTEDVELVDRSFILPDFRDREADIVYKVRMNENHFYFYLLELQSSVDCAPCSPISQELQPWQNGAHIYVNMNYLDEIGGEKTYAMQSQCR